MKIFKKEEKKAQYVFPPLVISVWSPMSLNTAPFSLELSRELSHHTSVLLCEINCLGIPKLAFCANIMDREKSMDTVIAEYEKNREINFNSVHLVSETLAILPASAYSNPDYPVPLRVETETLVNIPVQLINTACQNGYPMVVFECQGQLTNPMTFFAIKHADYVIIPAGEAAEIAVALSNLKRLIQVFKYSPEIFKIVSGNNLEEIQEVMEITDDDGRGVWKIDVISNDVKKIIEYIAHVKQVEIQDGVYKKKSSLGLLKKKRSVKEETDTDGDESELIIKI